MIPGPGMTAIETALWFLVAPVVLFVVISAAAYAGSAKRDKRKSVVDQID